MNTVDIRIIDVITEFLFFPDSVKAAMWLQDRCSYEEDGYKYFGGAVHVPRKKVEALINQLTAEKLTFTRENQELERVKPDACSHTAAALIIQQFIPAATPETRSAIACIIFTQCNVAYKGADGI
jgi:hypothetical protein